MSVNIEARFIQEVTMSLLQRTDRVTEADGNILVRKRPDDVTSSGTVKVVTCAAVATFWIAALIISIATLVDALLH
jgi:hypothetical protein